ncbi:hypothetical protein [Pararhodobacter sp.]|uniref:hypothetical protein n=1 Tax=Pararhodobacter sp. TaxID=2127056 RepID=UPI002FE07EC5
MRAAPSWDDFLIPGEVLLWHGRPRQGFLWRVAGQALWATGAALCLALGFWLLDLPGLMAGSSRGGLPLAGGALLLLGSVLILGRLVADRRRRARTYYALTDRAALILEDRAGGWHLSRCTKGQMRRMQLVEGDPGTLWFGQIHAADPRGAVIAGRSPRLGFRHIDDARRVWDLMAPHRKEIAG